MSKYPVVSTGGSDEPGTDTTEGNGSTNIGNTN